MRSPKRECFFNMSPVATLLAPYFCAFFIWSLRSFHRLGAPGVIHKDLKPDNLDAWLILAPHAEEEEGRKARKLPSSPRVFDLAPAFFLKIFLGPRMGGILGHFVFLQIWDLFYKTRNLISTLGSLLLVPARPVRPGLDVWLGTD